MTIRIATPADIPILMDLAARSETAAQWRRADYDRWFDPSGPSRIALVAEQSGGDGETQGPSTPAATAPTAGAEERVVAVAQDDTLKTLGFIVALCAGPEWEIENVVVSTAARRRGVGAQLVGELLKRARAVGAESVLLEVRESNRVARDLYERAGFCQSGIRPGYYSAPTEAAVIYRMDLKRRGNCR